MGTVYRKAVTKPLPANAEFFTHKGKRFARWTDAKGRKRKTHKAEVTTGQDGVERILILSRTYYANYRDGGGRVRVVPTGCRDEDAARRVLSDLERRAELVKAGVMTSGEDSAADYQTVPLADHFRAYLTTLEAEGTTKGHRENVERCLKRLAKECGWTRLNELTRDSLERWMTRQARAGMGARTRNLHRASAVAFCNWCNLTDRLVLNPLAKVKQADESADRRRERRALTEGELSTLLYVARYRPLAEFGRATIRKGRADSDNQKGRRTWNKAPLTLATLGETLERARHSLRDNPAFLEQQEALGRERALIYKTLVLTGLRKGELAAIRISQLILSGPMPCIELNAAEEKNREGSKIALRSDLAAELAQWLKDKLRAKQAECRRRREPIPARLAADERVFRVPAALVKILRRDLQFAGIPETDERGRTVDVHALRHSFGTLLNAAGVAPRTAQAAMRHSSIELTMNTYTDPKLLDVQGALDALPALPLDGGDGSAPEAATGTEEFAVKFAVTSGKPGLSCRNRQTWQSLTKPATADGDVDASACPVIRKEPLPIVGNGCQGERAKGLEPSTSSLGS